LLSKSAAGKLTAKMPTLILIWVWFCAYLNCAGWTLSALHQLNARGYAIALMLWFAGLMLWWKKNSASFSSRPSRPSRDNFCLRKFRRRFRKPFPLAFLILAVMAFLGGAIYPPTNYDALAYRIPRILHWLAADQWQWIHTDFPRVNNRSCGMEWVSAPFIALLKTDRFLFLINSISFLFLPGLVFSVFTRLGVRARVAWHWMWIVPTGYSFLLQAGSIGNDLFGATFALAAVDFALRAKNSRSPCDFFASILAAALMTSAKTSSLPLLLPWAIAIFPSLKLILQRPLRTIAVCVLAIFASAMPTMVLNQQFSNDWTGANLNRSGIVGDTALRTGANVFIIAVQNFVPPVFPMANAWNHDIEKIVPDGLNSRLHEVMTEYQAAEFMLPEMQAEEDAGLGFGVSMLVLISFLQVKFRRQKKTVEQQKSGSAWRIFLRWSPAIALLALMTQYGLSVFSRILTPYYALLIPILLADGGHGQLVKKRWWRTVTFAVFSIAAGLLIVSPARPLFPVLKILGKMPNAPARMVEVYSVYSERNDAFAPVRAALPPDLKILGLVTFDDPETSLWRPFGSRRIEHVIREDTAAQLKARGIEYILVKQDVFFGKLLDGTPDEWCARMNATIVQKIPLNLRAAVGPLDWYLIRLN
jgi:hypothetical protein